MARGHPYRPNLKLRRFRIALDLTQAEFGEPVGMARSHVCMVESGQERLGVDRTIKIVNHYRRRLIAAGLSFEDLLREQH